VKVVLPSLMRPKVDFLLKRTREVGLDFRPFKGLVDPWTQAKNWRQSRSIEEINQAIDKLDKAGAQFLAQILQEVGPQYGRWATNNLPGQSWHQYGEAVALMLVSPAGRTIWSANHPGYQQLAELAPTVGLHSGWHWKHRDVNHLQLKPDAVRAYHSWAELDAMIRRRYERQNDYTCGSDQQDQNIPVPAAQA
jgi:peptidoglycan L-alanyl-D-glutamate endopeptidase CwlK